MTKTILSIPDSITCPSYVFESSTNIPVDQILFFYQKIIGKERRLVTQIVWAPDKRYAVWVLEHMEINSPKMDAIQPSLDAHSLHDYKFKMMESRVITLSSTVDEVRDMIAKAAPDTKFATLHRAYTRADNRVVLLCPSQVTEAFQKYDTKIKEHPWGLDDGHDDIIRHCQARRERYVQSGGGGGVVDDFPQWWIGTYFSNGIYILENLEQIIQAIAEAAPVRF